MSAHCSPWAPGGVSQRTCQSLWTDLTAPCAAARCAVSAKVANAVITATTRSDRVAWKSIPGLNEPIVSRAPNPDERPAIPTGPESRPRAMVGPTRQGSVKQRIVAEKGTKRRRPNGGLAAGLWSHRRQERVHCDGAGIVV